MTDTVIVSTRKGKVRGKKEKSRFSGRQFYSFYGIPYGQPPIEDLRFKDPVEVKSWKSIYDATKPRGGCIQYTMRNYGICGSEDCLYVNVHTAKLPHQDEPLNPVIVHIHPGGYAWGSPDPEEHGSPDFVMHCGIVYVNICYRLNVLGFLNLGLEECSGNQGLKDIIMALRWIRDNIRLFNGDPTNITMLGSSSGAAMIQFLMLSPAAKGLFHKAVFMCGYAFNCVALEQENYALEYAFKFGRWLGFTGKNSKALLEFYKKLPAEIFQNNMKDFMRNSLKNSVISFPCGIFRPSIDKGKNAVLPMFPRKLIPTIQRIPLMVGICDHEGVMGFTGNHRCATEMHIKTSYLQNCWSWAHDLSNAEVDFAYKQIESFYMKNVSTEEDSLRIKNDIVGDAAYSDLYDTLIDVVSSQLPSSVFLYKFQYVGEIAELKNRIGYLFSDSLPGTFHADDFSYWAMMNEPKSDKTKQMVYNFTKLVSTFARTGDPNYEDIPVKWRPTNPLNPCYLRLNLNSEMVDGLLNGERMEFWHNLKKLLQRDKID